MTSQSALLPAIPSGRATRNRVAADEIGRAGQNPRGWRTHRVQKIGLDHEHRADLAGLVAPARIQVGDVERAVLDAQARSRPSPARWSSFLTSSSVAARV